MKNILFSTYKISEKEKGNIDWELYQRFYHLIINAKSRIEFLLLLEEYYDYCELYDIIDKESLDKIIINTKCLEENELHFKQIAKDELYILKELSLRAEIDYYLSKTDCITLKF